MCLDRFIAKIYTALLDKKLKVPVFTEPSGTKSSEPNIFESNHSSSKSSSVRNVGHGNKCFISKELKKKTTKQFTFSKRTQNKHSNLS